MRQKIHRFVFGSVLVFSVLGSTSVRAEGDPGHDSPEVAGHESQGREQRGPEEHGGDAVNLSAAELVEFGIEIGTVQSGTVTRTVTLPAEVRPNGDRLAHIAPRFPGIAKEVRKRVGDTVKAGEVLAIIESSGSLAPYKIKTEIAGVVIERHITLGEPVSPERGWAFTVADLSDVWIDISVYQKHIPYVMVGQPVAISAGHGFYQATGAISYISPIIDEETRTATARVVAPNPDGVWMPGLFVTAAIEVERIEAEIAVPRTALEVVEGNTVVFVRDDDGFEPRQVTLGREGKGLVEVTHGLAIGETLVIKGGFTLKSELARSELSGGHSH